MGTNSGMRLGGFLIPGVGIDIRAKKARTVARALSAPHAIGRVSIGDSDDPVCSRRSRGRPGPLPQIRLIELGLEIRIEGSVAGRRSTPLR